MRRSTSILPIDGEPTAAEAQAPEPDDVIVRIEPAGMDLVVPPGMTVMGAAAAAGVRWPSVCGGLAQCAVCAVEVVTSAAPLADPALREQQMLNRLATRPRQNGTMRLACQ